MKTYNIQDNNINNVNTRYKEENEMFQVNYYKLSYYKLIYWITQFTLLHTVTEHKEPHSSLL